MMRFAAVLIAVWTLLGAPALCQAGVLLHGCHDSICGHETSCDADPCSETVIKESPLAKSMTSPSPLLATDLLLGSVVSHVEGCIAPSHTTPSYSLPRAFSVPLLI